MPLALYVRFIAEKNRPSPGVWVTEVVSMLLGDVTIDGGGEVVVVESIVWTGIPWPTWRWPISPATSEPATATASQGDEVTQDHDNELLQAIIGSLAALDSLAQRYEAAAAPPPAQGSTAAGERLTGDIKTFLSGPDAR